VEKSRNFVLALVVPFCFVEDISAEGRKSPTAICFVMAALGVAVELDEAAVLL
jgi:hypothetical protein